MKKTFLLLLLGGVLTANAQPLIKRVLFIGNSYTSVNNLPLLTANAAHSAGDSLIYDSNLPGGTTFQYHSADATSRSKIIQGNWDKVVLQEQSQMLSFPISQVETDCFPFAKRLDSLIHAYNPCARTLFYMTWGRKNGDASNCPVWPPVCTYNGMDSLLNLRYRMIADSTHASVSPVGAVWHYLRQNYPAINLYQADESHPSLEGSYAAACCFYTSIYLKDPTVITYTAGLNPTDAASIRSAVKLLVYDSLSKWHLNTFLPNAQFSTALSAGTTVQFQNSSINAGNYQWYFGDGDSSSQFQPSHTYLQNGTYSVTLIASDCNNTDTLTMSILVGTNAVVANETIAVTIYPNPTTNELMLTGLGLQNSRISIVDVMGKKHNCSMATSVNKISIYTSTLKAGGYYLKIETAQNVTVRRFVKK